MPFNWKIEKVKRSYYLILMINTLWTRKTNLQESIYCISDKNWRLSCTNQYFGNCEATSKSLSVSGNVQVWLWTQKRLILVHQKFRRLLWNEIVLDAFGSNILGQFFLFQSCDSGSCKKQILHSGLYESVKLKIT